jgi:lipoprotein-anchoring transpeptidase ErfK/SrfK
MNKRQYWSVALILATAFALAGCEMPANQPATNSANSNAPVKASQNSNSAPANTNVSGNQPKATMFTMPMLKAFLADANFVNTLKTRLQLTDGQINQLKALADETKKPLPEASGSGDNSSTDARNYAFERVRSNIGEEKTRQLAALLNEDWQSGASLSANASTLAASPNVVPADTRVVVNAPAYRMDIFENGQLVKSYKVGIGYPEFPLPVGLRQAREIIFNPTWTPPDEPWVEGSDKVKVGQKVEAGSKLNPLGIAKIPIGMPSLIHGGKKVGQIGGFASHGCVGLTDVQLRDFVVDLAKLGGAALSDQQIAEYGRNRTETKNVKLNAAVPIELRYETIVVEEGKLHIYRDVYDMDTNNEENLRLVLAKYGVTPEQLSPAERAQVSKALRDMSRDAKGNADNGAVRKENDKKPESESAQVTRTVKGAKEVVIAVAALADKGYPAPVALNTGGAKPLTTAAMPKRRS